MEQRSSVNSPCLDNSQTRYVSADHGFPPPHIIVAYKGRRRAYGRKAIKDMGYSVCPLLPYDKNLLQFVTFIFR
ncbi:hypothetical protein SERLA73DRAFT_136320, partial [Serpula lacrymans var. lacrymans S7.3]